MKPAKHIITSLLKSYHVCEGFLVASQVDTPFLRELRGSIISNRLIRLIRVIRSKKIRLCRVSVICCSIACVLQLQSVFAQEIGDAKEVRKARDVSKIFPIHSEERCVSYNVGAYWDSKYISEGRNNLSDGGMFSVDGSVAAYGFTVGAWYAVADTISYDELNMFLEYGFELGPLELSAGYTRLEFLKDEEFDNELSCGTALNCIPYIIPAIDYVYSTEADGSFVELSVSAPVKFLEGRFVLTPYVLEGIDIGYASEDYDGYNNTQVGLAADYAITEHICLVGTVNHSWVNQDVRQDDGDDESWLSLGIMASF